jgi:hypothetical protein
MYSVAYCALLSRCPLVWTDTSTCKKGVPGWLLEDPVNKLEPLLPNKKEKIHRGLAHPAFARALTPMVWEASKRYHILSLPLPTHPLIDVLRIK